MGRNLTNLYISESFNYVMQVSGSNVQDGLGASLSGSVLDLHVVSASYAVSASHEIIKEVSSSFADFAQVAQTASSSLDSLYTASVVNSTITFTKGDGSTFDITVAQSGSVSSASYATYAESAGEVAYVDITNKPTLVSGSSQIILQNTTGDLSGSRINGAVASATSASHAVQADSALTATTATTSTYSDNTIVYGKNLSGSPIAKGTPLYFTGSGTSGNLVGVWPADAGNPLRMPAGGVAGELLTTPGGEGIVILDGFINGVNTSTFQSGQAVYVAVGGGYTNVKPTGSANLIQALGYVEKAAVNGSGVIKGSGRANDVPNITQNYAWVGNVNGVATPTAVSSLSVASAVSASHSTYAETAAFATDALDATTAQAAISSSHALVSDTVNDANVAYINQNNIFTGTQTFDNIAVNGTGSFAYIQSVTGSAKIIGDAYIILNNNLPAERYAGIVVQDSGSGSPLTTASLEFDGQTNDWFYEYSNDGGTTTDHGVVIFGPEYSTKGSPTYLTANTIPKSSGSHHIVDSIMSDDGSKVAVTGHVEQNFTAPGTNEEIGFANVTGAAVNGKNYNRVFYGIADYPSFGNQYEDYFAIEYYDGLSYNFGSEFNVNGKQTQLYTKASGSGQESYIRTTDNYDGTSQVSISSGNKIVINGKTEITGSTEIKLSGAQSLKVSKPGTGIFTTTGNEAIAQAGNTQAVLGTPYAGTIDLRNTSTGDDFGLAADMSQYGFLGDWTGPGIFSNDTSDNYPTIIGFQNKASWSDGRVTFLTPVYSNVDMVVSSSTGFPLEVDGTMDVRRIHFSKNPFNNLENGTLGAIRMDGTNKSFYSTLYNDAYNQSSQSKFIAELDTTSSFSAAALEVNYGGTQGSFEVRNDNGTRTTTLVTDSYIITGSVRGEVNALSIASTTASLDAATGNFFTLALVDGANTHVDASNIKPGQTYILRSTNGASGTGTVSFAPEFKFAGGTAPTGSTGASAVDVFTFVSFDSTNVFATAVEKLS